MKRQSQELSLFSFTDVMIDLKFEFLSFFVKGKVLNMMSVILGKLQYFLNKDEFNYFLEQKRLVLSKKACIEQSNTQSCLATSCLSLVLPR